MLSTIDNKISQKLKDKGYRQRFFKGRAEDEIAYSLRRFRKVRGLNQSDLAARCGMKQSAISRIEQASYSKWNFTTLWRIAEALDVRVRVMIDDTADAINEYRRMESVEQDCAFTISTPKETIGAEESSTPNILNNQAVVSHFFIQ